MDVSKKSILYKNTPEEPAQSNPAVGMLHSAVLIYAWICLVLAIPMLNDSALIMLSGILIALSLCVCRVRFVSLLRRTKWIMVSVLLIYAYTTQGAALLPQLGSFSPVTDGFVEGFLQLLRLLSVLAGLSLLLSVLSQSQLIAGLYTLSLPLSFFGLPRERIVVRLALTLRYAEIGMQDTKNNWRGNIVRMLEPVKVEPEIIELHLASFDHRDWLLAAIASLALLGVWL